MTSRAMQSSCILALMRRSTSNLPHVSLWLVELQGQNTGKEMPAVLDEYRFEILIRLVLR